MHRSPWPDRATSWRSPMAPTPRSTRWPPPCWRAVRKEKALAKVSLEVPAERVWSTTRRSVLARLALASRRPAGGRQHRAAGDGRGRRARGRDGARGARARLMTRFDEALAQLDARQPEHMPGPSLERIRRSPTTSTSRSCTYPTIHVTGTNGKSTAARVAAAVACAHGLHAGLFTSPHLRRGHGAVPRLRRAT